MGNNQVQTQAGLPISPVVRVARLGGLCVVAATGLIAAGVLLSRRHTAEALLASLALTALPAMALGGLALHRVSRTPQRPAH